MALKRKEIKHLLSSGTMQTLDQLIENLVNNGWTVLEAKFIGIDKYNQEFTCFYIMAKNIEDDKYS